MSRWLAIAVFPILTACAPGAVGGGLPVFDDVDGTEHWSCEGDPGPARVELCDLDSAYTPLADGVEFAIARRPQGEITIFAPLWFGGLEGGSAVSDLEIVFESSDGTELGGRRSSRQMLPCDDDGHVVAEWLEVYFDRFAVPEDFDGRQGSLWVEMVSEDGELLLDQVSGVLRAQ